MKKVFALILALVLVLSLGVVAFAGGNEQAEIITPVQPIEREHTFRFPFYTERSGEVDIVVLEEDNPDTGAPVVLPVVTAVAVLAGAAYVVSKRK